jgi:hypothetical protein
MSREYVEARIREALRMNGGNEAKAKRQIHAWLYEDHKLLLELVGPHLNGILAYLVTRSKNAMLVQKDTAQTTAGHRGRVHARDDMSELQALLQKRDLQGSALGAEALKAQKDHMAKQPPVMRVAMPTQSRQPKTQNQEAKNPADFGENLLRSFVSKESARFGYENHAAPIKRKVASQKHVDTMHLLAAASKKKLDETYQSYNERFFDDLDDQ